ncbi:MAG: hypothetical protein ACOVMM_05280 [Chitinophagaceae bacterium]
MKQLISILAFIPALIMLFINEKSLQEGIYTNKVVTAICFVIMGAAINVLLHTKVLKGWASWFAYGAIIFLGLFIPTLF